MHVQQASCTISVDEPAASAGTYSLNDSHQSATQRLDVTGVNATLTVQAAPTLTKAFGAANVGLGQTTTLAFSIANTGANAVNSSGLSFTDTLPAGLTIANPPAVTSATCGTPTFTRSEERRAGKECTVRVTADHTRTITHTMRGTTLGAKGNGEAQIPVI